MTGSGAYRCDARAVGLCTCTALALLLSLYSGSACRHVGAHRTACASIADPKKKKAPALVAEHLRTWLTGQFPQTFKKGSDFGPFMEALMQADPPTYQAINAEAFAWLKWLRQMAAARKNKD